VLLLLLQLLTAGCLQTFNRNNVTVLTTPTPTNNNNNNNNIPTHQ